MFRKEMFSTAVPCAEKLSINQDNFPTSHFPIISNHSSHSVMMLVVILMILALSCYGAISYSNFDMDVMTPVSGDRRAYAAYDDDSCERGPGQKVPCGK